MISRIVLFLVFCQSSFLFSQVSDADMEKLKTKWRVELHAKGRELALKQSNEGMSQFSDSIQRLFLEDTFVVENLFRRQMDKDNSNLGIIKSALAGTSEYEFLIDKYYAILLSKMKPDDQELLISWQESWKTLMDKERVLIGKLMQEEYSGGGSIQALNYADRLLEAKKHHVFQLIDYLITII